jgi:hypothetical protein
MLRMELELLNGQTVFLVVSETEEEAMVKVTPCTSTRPWQ